MGWRLTLTREYLSPIVAHSRLWENLKKIHRNLIAITAITREEAGNANEINATDFWTNPNSLRWTLLHDLRNSSELSLGPPCRSDRPQPYRPSWKFQHREFSYDSQPWEVCSPMSHSSSAVQFEDARAWLMWSCTGSRETALLARAHGPTGLLAGWPTGLQTDRQLYIYTYRYENVCH